MKTEALVLALGGAITLASVSERLHGRQWRHHQSSATSSSIAAVATAGDVLASAAPTVAPVAHPSTTDNSDSNAPLWPNL